MEDGWSRFVCVPISRRRISGVAIEPPNSSSSSFDFRSRSVTKGIGIGNGLTDPEIQYQYYKDMIISTNGHEPAVGDRVHAMMEKTLPACIDAIDACNANSSSPLVDAGECLVALELCEITQEIPYTLTGAWMRACVYGGGGGGAPRSSGGGGDTRVSSGGNRAVTYAATREPPRMMRSMRCARLGVMFHRFAAPVRRDRHPSRRPDRGRHEPVRHARRVRGPAALLRESGRR